MPSECAIGADDAAKAHDFGRVLAAIALAVLALALWRGYGVCEEVGGLIVAASCIMLTGLLVAGGASPGTNGDAR